MNFPTCPTCGFPTGAISTLSDIVITSQCSCFRQTLTDHPSSWMRLYTQGVARCVSINGDLHIISGVNMEQTTGLFGGCVNWKLTATTMQPEGIAPSIYPECHAFYELLDRGIGERVEINNRDFQVVSVNLYPLVSMEDRMIGWQLIVQAIPF